MTEPLDDVELEQAAACCDNGGGQPAARAWVRSLESDANAILCVGKEGDEVLALSAGAVQIGEASSSFLLHELCVASRRTECGIGAELLAFTLRQAHARGSKIAIASARLEARGAAFLIRRGFKRDDASGMLQRAILAAG